MPFFLFYFFFIDKFVKIYKNFSSLVASNTQKFSDFWIFSTLPNDSKFEHQLWSSRWASRIQKENSSVWMCAEREILVVVCVKKVVAGFVVAVYLNESSASHRSSDVIKKINFQMLKLYFWGSFVCEGQGLAYIEPTFFVLATFLYEFSIFFIKFSIF